MMIGALSEIDKNEQAIGDLRKRLLQNKQTNNWQTTKATAEACYALSIQGTNWLSEEKNVIINLRSTVISSPIGKDLEGIEAGTGYFKHKIGGDKVNPEMGNISVTVSTIKESLKASPNGEGLEEV